MHKINYYNSVLQPKVTNSITILKWFNSISGSSYSNLITQAREGNLDYKETKRKKLPCVTYNFLFNEYRADNNIISSTGLMYIDVDDPTFKLDLIDKSKVLAFYKSFGGLGCGIVIKISGLTTKNFRTNYEHIANELGIISYVDLGAAKASQLNVLSYDPDIYVNINAQEFVAIEPLAVPHSITNVKTPNRLSMDGGTVLRFDNLNEVEIENEYKVNWEGWYYVKCWPPYKQQQKGRNRLLHGYAVNLVWLNPWIEFDMAYDVISNVNQASFKSPLPDYEISLIVRSVLKKQAKKELTPIVFKKPRKILFNKKDKFTREEILSICGKENTKKKISDSKEKMKQIIENWDYETNGPISIRKISTAYPISKKTVAKYYPLFKEQIIQMNKV
jgi:hypothetical protein